MNLVIKILFIAFVMSLGVFSQENQGNFPGGTISGKILDSSTKHVIEYANIVVFSSKDSSMLTGGVTNKEGVFKLSISKPGRYNIQIRFIGYDTDTLNATIKPGSLNVELGEIYIHPSAVNLSDVVVQGERSPVTYEIDKKVIDPDQMQTVISGNAADVLANVPSVQVDVDGNVSLRGSQNFTVLIDGRPSLLDPQDALQQISATSIDKIEIITNPNAKYDAQGTSGIINIILKKNLSQGLNGIVNANAGMYDNYGGNFLFNYQDGYKLTLGFDYNQRGFPGDNTQNNIYYLQNDTSTINSDGRINRKRTSYEGRVGIDLNLDENNLLSFGVRIGKRDFGMTANRNYFQTSSLDPSIVQYLGNSDRSREGTYYSISTNYTRDFNQNGHQLMAELIFNHQNSDENTTTSEFDETGQFSGKDTKEFGPESEFRWKLDYTLPFSDDNKFETGYQGDIEQSDENNELYEYNPLNNQYEIQPQYTNLNNYFEDQQAMYVMYSNIFFQTNFQAGLRAEYTYRNIEVPLINQSFKIDRIDYFPSLHLSYKFSSISTAMASYSRRINQPRGWALEPFPTWIDANNVRTGNPDLLPEFIDSYETGVQSALGNISISLEGYYRMTSNKIEAVRTALGDDVTLTTFANVGKDYSLGAELMVILDPFIFWNINFMGNFYNYKVEGTLQGEPFSNESLNWQSRMNNTFKLWSSTQIQFNTRYNSPSATAQGEWAGYFSSDLSIRQDIISNILSLTLQVRDVFGTAKREYTSQGTNLYNYNYFDMQTPLLVLNLRYSFNNYKPKSEGRGEDNSGFKGGEDF